MLDRYADRLPIIRRAAYGLGYAIGLHGSGERDLDLIAVPWTEQAASAKELVAEIRQEIDGVILDGSVAGLAFKNPAYRPHGRRAWSIQIGGGLYVDLSVMPLDSFAPVWPEGTPGLAVRCVDCGKPYGGPDWLDCVLPNDQWSLIMGQLGNADDPGGILCANCIIARAARLGGFVRARLVLEIA